MMATEAIRIIRANWATPSALEGEVGIEQKVKRMRRGGEEEEEREK